MQAMAHPVLHDTMMLLYYNFMQNLTQKLKVAECFLREYETILCSKIMIGLKYMVLKQGTVMLYVFYYLCYAPVIDIAGFFLKQIWHERIQRTILLGL
jgi:hypothetical protein